MELLSYLSHHVLRTLHARTFPEEAAKLPPAKEAVLELPQRALEALAEPVLCVAAARAAQARDGFLEVAAQAKAEHAAWHAAADSMTAEYRQLLAQVGTSGTAFYNALPHYMGHCITEEVALGGV